MAFLDSVPEIVAGVGVEVLVFTIAGAVVFRTLSGRFLVPKREIVLPNQLGVVVQDDRIVRVAQPGTCWIRPRQRVVLIDARPKPLQMTALEVLGSDRGVVRLSLVAEYKVTDAAVYYSSSANAADTLFLQLRRVLNVMAREKTSGALVASIAEYAARVSRAMLDATLRLGLQIEHLDIYEAVPLGFCVRLRNPRLSFLHLAWFIRARSRVLLIAVE